MVRGGFVGLNHPKHMSGQVCCSLCCTVVQTGLEQLNHPEPMRNYSMIVVSSGSAVISVVCGGLVWLNHFILMRNYPTLLVPSGVQWFKEVL